MNQDEGIILPMVRLVKDEEFGLVPETVTRREFEILRYEYSAIELAGLWFDRKLELISVTLPDLDDDAHKLSAIVPKDAAEDFDEACHALRHDRLETALSNAEAMSGYTWAPIGKNAGFGFYSPVSAWLVPIQDIPALLYRFEDEEAEDLVDKWMRYWLQFPLPTGWPADKEKYAKLVVPRAMKEIVSTRQLFRGMCAPGSRRTALRQRYRKLGKI